MGAHEVVVISASEDEQLARETAQALDRAGLGFRFFSGGSDPIGPGRESIERAIDRSPVVVFILTPHALASGFVKQSLELATARQRRLIFLSVDELAVPPWLQWYFGDAVRASTVDDVVRLAIRTLNLTTGAYPPPTAAAPSPPAAARMFPFPVGITVMLAAVAAAGF